MPTGIPDDRQPNRDATEQADLRRTWVNLTGFRRDCLTMIRAFEANGHAPKGLEILETLEAERGTSVNHGRLYPNLDQLADAGLVAKGTKDKRTNEYTLTDRGRKVLRAGSTRFATLGGDDE